MPSETAPLVGAWGKSENPACAALYPAVVRFEANGLYRGETDPPGRFAIWDVGTWQADAPGQIAISIANDAVVSYAYDLSGDLLTFTNPEGCRFSFRRLSL